MSNKIANIDGDADDDGLTEAQRTFCASVADGTSVKLSAAAIGVSTVTIYRWASRLPAFARALSTARAISNRCLVDDLLTIPTDPRYSIDQARLISDAIKWRASRELRAEYGDKLDVSVEHSVDLTGALADARSRVRLLPICDPAQIVDAIYTEESTGYEPKPGDKQSPAPSDGALGKPDGSG